MAAIKEQADRQSLARTLALTVTVTVTLTLTLTLNPSPDQVRETAISKTPRGITPVRPDGRPMQMTGLRVVNQPS